MDLSSELQSPTKGFAGEISSLKFDCDCRKPKPGLIVRAAKDFNIDIEASWMIGDGWRDVECGINAGTHTVLITGEGTEGGECERLADMTAPDLLRAVKKIICLQ